MIWILRFRSAALLSASVALAVGCGGDDGPGTSMPMAGAAGTGAPAAGSGGSGGATSAGTSSGGAAVGGGGASSGAGGLSGAGMAGALGGAGSAGATGGPAGTAGSAGTAGASGGGGGGGGAAGRGGSAGAAGGTNAGSGGGGGAGGGKSALAMIAPTSGNQITGTATFTQSGQSVTLVVQLSNCPAGAHAAHLHETKSCGNNGEAAGGHWVPQGEVIPDITCMANGSGMVTVTPPAGTWSIGSGAGDVTSHAIIVHQAGGANPGGRLGCGLIELAP